MSMSYIFNFLSLIFGYLLNVFYILLDWIGTPYIWLCIVLFSITTRLIFFPGKLRAARKKRLAPVLDQELTDIKSRYLLSDDDEVDKKQMNREIKAVYKKYRVSAGSGCLSALLQLPIYSFPRSSNYMQILMGTQKSFRAFRSYLAGALIFRLCFLAGRHSFFPC